MARDDEKKLNVAPSAPRAPGPHEVAILHAIHRFTDRVVLTPVVLNGQERFALALLCQNAQGEQYLQVLAHLTLPTDVVLDSRGVPGYNKPPPVKKDLN